MLTEAQIQQFHDQGFLVFESLIQGEKLDYYVSVFDELVENGKEMTENKDHFYLEKDGEGRLIPGLLHKVQGVCVAEPRVLGLAREPAILDRVEPIIGPNIDVFGTKFFPKLPDGGTSVHWHQDNYFFGSTSDRVLSCAIYFEETDRANGCLRVIPQSHLAMAIAEHQNRENLYGSWVDLDDSDAVDVECPAGTAVFFSANLLHGTRENVSRRSRYSTAWHYIPGELPLDRFPRTQYRDRHIVRGE